MSQGSTGEKLGSGALVSACVLRGSVSESFLSPARARVHVRASGHALRLGTHRGDGSYDHDHAPAVRPQARESPAVYALLPALPLYRRIRCRALENEPRSVSTKAHPCGTRAEPEDSACTTDADHAAVGSPSVYHCADGHCRPKQWRTPRPYEVTVCHTLGRVSSSLLR